MKRRYKKQVTRFIIALMTSFCVFSSLSPAKADTITSNVTSYGNYIVTSENFSSGNGIGVGYGPISFQLPFTSGSAASFKYEFNGAKSGSFYININAYSGFILKECSFAINGATISVMPSLTVSSSQKQFAITFTNTDHVYFDIVIPYPSMFVGVSNPITISGSNIRDGVDIADIDSTLDTYLPGMSTTLMNIRTAVEDSAGALFDIRDALVDPDTDINYILYMLQTLEDIDLTLYNDFDQIINALGSTVNGVYHPYLSDLISTVNTNFSSISSILNSINSRLITISSNVNNYLFNLDYIADILDVVNSLNIPNYSTVLNNILSAINNLDFDIDIPDYSSEIANINTKINTLSTTLSTVSSTLSSINTNLTTFRTSFMNQFHSNLNIPLWQIPAYIWVNYYKDTSGQYSAWQTNSNTGYNSVRVNTSNNNGQWTNTRSVNLSYGQKKLIVFVSNQYIGPYGSQYPGYKIIPEASYPDGFLDTIISAGSVPFEYTYYLNWIIIDYPSSFDNDTWGFEIEFNTNYYIGPFYLGNKNTAPAEILSALGWRSDLDNTYISLLEQIASGIGNISQTQITENQTNINNYNNYQTTINSVEQYYQTDYNTYNNIVNNYDYFDFLDIPTTGVNTYWSLFNRIWEIKLVSWPLMVVLLGTVLIIILG